MTESKQSKEDDEKRLNQTIDCMNKTKEGDSMNQIQLRKKDGDEKKECKENNVNYSRNFSDSNTTQCLSSESEEKEKNYELISHIQKHPDDREAQEKIVLQYE